jgi:hypothetical protein
MRQRLVWLPLMLAALTVACAGSKTESVSTDVCASGTLWTGGNEESPEMNPGQACISCHQRGEGPSFSIAGTVFAKRHEADNCFGTSNALIRITPHGGQSFDLPVNAAGNFYANGSTSDLALPFTASLIIDGVETKMVTPQTVGDCNSCHTPEGANLAPGRIAPAPAM